MPEPQFLGTVTNLSVYGGIPGDFFSSWDCLQDCYRTFFDDTARVTGRKSFEGFCRRSIADVAVAREPEGRIVCVGYAVYETDHSLCFHGYCAPEYRTPEISIPCAALGIAYFFRQYPGLLRLSVLGRWSNRVARLYAMRQGFHITRLPHYLLRDGKLIDAYFGYMLREEVLDG